MIPPAWATHCFTYIEFAMYPPADGSEWDKRKATADLWRYLHTVLELDPGSGIHPYPSSKYKQRPICPVKDITPRFLTYLEAEYYIKGF